MYFPIKDHTLDDELFAEWAVTIRLSLLVFFERSKDFMLVSSTFYVMS